MEEEEEDDGLAGAVAGLNIGGVKPGEVPVTDFYGTKKAEPVAEEKKEEKMNEKESKVEEEGEKKVEGGTKKE